MPRAVITLHDIEQGSQEWLDARVDMYTGSNAHKLLTKLGAADLQYAKSQESSFGGNFWTERGHLLEEEAIELYEAIKGVKVQRTGFVTNSQFPGCLYSPDGLLMANGRLIEVKCFDELHHMELIRAKKALDVPLKILAQTHYGMTITALPDTDLIAYNPKMENVKDKFKIIPIKRDRVITNNFKRILQPVKV